MSRSFYSKILKPLVKSFKSDVNSLEPEFTNLVNLAVGTISTVTILGHCAYAFVTVENKNIVIKRKYKFNRNGFTEFMVIDENDKHYNVNNSLWHWKWDSIEDWNKLEPNKEFNIKYYG